MANHGWQVGFTGWVQVDDVAWAENSPDEVDANGNPQNDERFLIRRGRLKATGKRGPLTAIFELDGSTNGRASARVLGARVSWALPRAEGDKRPSLLVITAGLMKIPFGVEVPFSERKKPFLEAPVFTRALLPGNYDAGVEASGAVGIARWVVAAMNGSPVSDAQWHGLDPTSSYDFVGRVSVLADGPRGSAFEAGVSALAGTGLHAGDMMMPSETFSRHALGVDAKAHWCIDKLGKGIGFFEGALATNLDRSIVYADPVAEGRDLREVGFQFGASQDVGKYARVGARYDRYDADRDGDRAMFSTLGVMATAHWDETRLLVQYDRELRRGDGRFGDRVTARVQMGF